MLIHDHHAAYIDCTEYERNQALLAANAYGRVGGQKSGRGGRALLAGMLTCGRWPRTCRLLYRVTCGKANFADLAAMF